MNDKTPPAGETAGGGRASTSPATPAPWLPALNELMLWVPASFRRLRVDAANYIEIHQAGPGDVGGGRTARLDQTSTDILYAALAHHQFLAEHGFHDDADPDFREVYSEFGEQIAQALQEYPAIIEALNGLLRTGLWGDNVGAAAVGLMRAQIMRLWGTPFGDAMRSRPQERPSASDLAQHRHRGPEQAE